MYFGSHGEGLVSSHGLLDETGEVVTTAPPLLAGADPSYKSHDKKLPRLFVTILTQMASVKKSAAVYTAVALCAAAALYAAAIVYTAAVNTAAFS